MIRLLITDDHTLLREALGSMLDREPGLSVAGQAHDCDSTLSLYRELRPDVVLMDVTLPEISGIEVTRRLVSEIPSVRVLGLSARLERHYVSGMLDAGAIGYIHKSINKDELIEGIHAAMSGTPYLSQNVAFMLARSPVFDEDGDARLSLTKRESEVLPLIADGKSSAEIAMQLRIAVGTAEVHRRNIFRKLGMHNVADLIKYSIREGLISI